MYLVQTQVPERLLSVASVMPPQVGEEPTSPESTQIIAGKPHFITINGRATSSKGPIPWIVLGLFVGVLLILVGVVTWRVRRKRALAAQQPAGIRWVLEPPLSPSPSQQKSRDAIPDAALLSPHYPMPTHFDQRQHRSSDHSFTTSPNRDSTYIFTEEPNRYSSSTFNTVPHSPVTFAAAKPSPIQQAQMRMREAQAAPPTSFPAEPPAALRSRFSSFSSASTPPTPLSPVTFAPTKPSGAQTAQMQMRQGPSAPLPPPPPPSSFPPDAARSRFYSFSTMSTSTGPQSPSSPMTFAPNGSATREQSPTIPALPRFSGFSTATVPQTPKSADSFVSSMNLQKATTEQSANAPPLPGAPGEQPDPDSTWFPETPRTDRISFGSVLKQWDGVSSYPTSPSYMPPLPVRGGDNDGDSRYTVDRSTMSSAYPSSPGYVPPLPGHGGDSEGNSRYTVNRSTLTSETSSEAPPPATWWVHRR
ncbi:hypothetical protein C8J57DRAFT_1313308 [Mycena rebaudengoi]|nr:hypothetical protein C8J57DRAFT_1313308 [Mycena rebaudengoi]